MKVVAYDNFFYDWYLDFMVKYAGLWIYFRHIRAIFVPGIPRRVSREFGSLKIKKFPGVSGSGFPGRRL